MPRKAKGPHLKLEGPVIKDGKLVRRAAWVIVDRDKKHRTGCGADEFEQAQLKLAAYIVEQHEVNRDEERHPSQIPAADVINVYATDRGPHVADPKSLKARLQALLDWWGDKMLSDVSGKSCRDYVKARLAMPWKQARPDTTGKPPRMMSVGGVRRELEDLQAAINYHHKEGLCSQKVAVTLPAKPPPRDVFLTRSEAAQMIWAAGRFEEPRHLEHFVMLWRSAPGG